MIPIHLPYKCGSLLEIIPLSFLVKHAKYQQVVHNDLITLYQGMHTRAFVDIREYRMKKQEK